MVNHNAHTVISNVKISKSKLLRAQEIISALQQELPHYIEKGHGPFLAAIYDKKGKLIAKEANSVVSDVCSHNHAEINVIRTAEKILKTYDLSPYDLAIYVTAEPCMMCLGSIMWSGIKEVYYGVSSKSVEKITGFDEGFKPNWLDEFKKRKILVCGQIEEKMGEQVLKDYSSKHEIYAPKR